MSGRLNIKSYVESYTWDIHTSGDSRVINISSIGGRNVVSVYVETGWYLAWAKIGTHELGPYVTIVNEGLWGESSIKTATVVILYKA